MTHVVVKNGNIDGALKKFKQKVAKNGIPSELKSREHFEKPGIKRRKRKENAKKEAKRNNKRNNRDY